jgi:hypothetical protein
MCYIIGVNMCYITGVNMCYIIGVNMCVCVCVCVCRWMYAGTCMLNYHITMCWSWPGTHLYVCRSKHACVYTPNSCVTVHVCVNICMLESLFILWSEVHTYSRVCVHVNYTCVRVCIQTYIHYTYIHIYIYIYTHTHTQGHATVKRAHTFWGWTGSISAAQPSHTTWAWTTARLSPMESTEWLCA